MSSIERYVAPRKSNTSSRLATRHPHWTFDWPVSSQSSRLAASWVVSPASPAPPGVNHHVPSPGRCGSPPRKSRVLAPGPMRITRAAGRVMGSTEDQRIAEACRAERSRSLERRPCQEEPLLAADVEHHLGLGAVAGAGDFPHRAEAPFVVAHAVAGADLIGADGAAGTGHLLGLGPATALASPLHQVVGDLVEEPGPTVVVGASVEHAARRRSEEQPLLGSGDADVGETTLLFELVRLPQGAHVGEHPLLRSEEHTSEPQSRENLVCRLP